MGPAGPETKNDCAGKDQQQFTRLTKEIAPLPQTFRTTLQTQWSMI
jgi:hypothetical protein